MLNKQFDKDLLASVCVCVVYDKVAETYSAPMVFDNVNCAIRWFALNTNLCTTAEPTDFELYSLGYYEPDNGKMYVFEQKKFLVKGEINDDYRRLIVQEAVNNVNGEK